MRPTAPMKHDKHTPSWLDGWTKKQLYRECGSKIRHKTRADAIRSARKCMELRGGHISVYLCRFCGGYHLTSKTTVTNANGRVFEG